MCVKAGWWDAHVLTPTNLDSIKLHMLNDIYWTTLMPLYFSFFLCIHSLSLCGYRWHKMKAMHPTFFSVTLTQTMSEVQHVSAGYAAYNLFKGFSKLWLCNGVCIIYNTYAFPPFHSFCESMDHNPCLHKMLLLLCCIASEVLSYDIVATRALQCMPLQIISTPMYHVYL